MTKSTFRLFEEMQTHLLPYTSILEVKNSSSILEGILIASKFYHVILITSKFYHVKPAQN